MQVTLEYSAKINQIKSLLSHHMCLILKDNEMHF